MSYLTNRHKENRWKWGDHFQRLVVGGAANGAMWRTIIGTGLAFFAVLISLLYYLDCTPLTSLTEIGRLTVGTNTGMTPYELSLFFTIFVFLQFWNMFNARAFSTGRSALHFKGCRGFLLIAAIIFVGQILIVEFGGELFNVTPLLFTDWLIIIVCTSIVLWIGEAIRAVGREERKGR